MSTPGIPQQPQSPSQAQPGYAPPQGHTAPQYQVPPAYAPQPQQPAWQPAPQPQAPRAAGGRVNILGVIALVILLLQALGTLFAPAFQFFLAIQIGLDFSLVSLIQTGINVFVLLIAGALALAGVLQKSAPRLRWTAIGSLVAVCLSLVAMVTGLLGGLIVNLLY